MNFPITNPPRGLEARRLWILEEAEALCIPGWATRRWRSLYAPKSL